MASHASTRPLAVRVPRPSRAGAPFAVLCLLGLALVAAPQLPWSAGAATGALFLLAAALRTLQSELDLRRLRRETDRLLLRGVATTSRSPVVLWRSAELTDERNRRRLVRGVDRLLADLDPAKLPGASPLDRVSARRHERLIRLVGARLADLDRPVQARGVLLADWLLRDADSPLYAGGSADVLARSLARTLAALER